MIEFYSCDEHIEDVIDDFINKYCESPNIYLNREINRTCCNYCNKYSKYILLNF